MPASYLTAPYPKIEKAHSTAFSLQHHDCKFVGAKYKSREEAIMKYFMFRVGVASYGYALRQK